jgi:hypothetical protein
VEAKGQKVVGTVAHKGQDTLSVPH